jgi:hypothetical protein
VSCRLVRRVSLALLTEARTLAWETLGNSGRATVSALASMAGVGAATFLLTRPERRP